MIPRQFDLARLNSNPRDPTLDMTPVEKVTCFSKMYGISEDEFLKRESKAVLGQQKIMAEVVRGKKYAIIE